ncbi:unnamed protein product [Rotaria sp. Silwood2]|nr:unnamed protein product [Rotaria sp. Silwood2]CAF4494648.1 unnamed protein product [Rotaria sp. Silwood2]CAF4674937.1 unnamed protein product [Rotaria sp. Silwood2]
MCILVFLAVHCNALIGKKSDRSVNKRGCARLGEVCTTSFDCCGHDDPESGHCVVCYSFWASLTGKGQEKCGCSYGSVTVDPDTHRVISNVCNGPDRSGNSICRTRVAPPGDRYYRGSKLF